MPSRLPSRGRRSVVTLIAGVTLAALPACDENPIGETASGSVVDAPEVLRFSIREGRTDNHFYRQGSIAAHAVLTNGTGPRLLVAFPAGNSGVSLWFRPTDETVSWSVVDDIRPVSAATPDGDPLLGIEAQIEAEGAELVVDAAVLSNIRVIRNYLHEREIPDEVVAPVSIDDNVASWYRDRLDGQGGYRLVVAVEEGLIEGGGDAPVRFVPPADGPLRLRVTALTGDPPLTPIETGELLAADAVDDPLARNVLAFLSYREKLLAGSWRFLTYFGRDTLMSVRLLMPALSSTAIEAGLASVLARLNEAGEVAHEEDIGEFALLRRDGESDTPIYDYHMIDDDFMLAPIVVHYLLDNGRGRQRAETFLALENDSGRTNGAALVDNLRFVLESARPFARAPGLDALIRLKPESPAGQWRDSREGLGFGRIPYDVNAVWIPAALDAIARLDDSGLLDPYLETDDALAGAAKLEAAWCNRAAEYFVVDLSLAEAERRVEAYAADIGVPAAPALSRLRRDMTPPADRLRFHAVALDGDGGPVPVMHSDEGFALLFLEPPAEALATTVAIMSWEFPAGLLTPVGLLAANPAYAPADIRPLFSPARYHGAVVWSWHQALFAAGLDRQSGRPDLAPAQRRQLRAARDRLWSVIRDTDALRTSELWSWSWRDGEYRMEPFGQRAGDETESNAAQLWSTVYLAIPPPEGGE